jgi:hypothetical protein
MSEETQIDPKHAATRRVLRTAGPGLAGLGLVLVLIGMVNFFSSFGSFESPRYFWCAFLGLPLLFVGTVLCMLGFLGPFSRYVLGEAAPVQKDTFNYMAEGTQAGVRTIATAVGEGFSAGRPVVRCQSCGHANGAGAKFCNNCGAPLTR